MDRTLARKRAVITGSTQGLGLAIARRLASAGCDIVLNGLGDPNDVAVLQRQIEADFAVGCVYSPADLSDPSAIENMMSLGGGRILEKNAVVRHVAAIESMPRDH